MVLVTALLGACTVGEKPGSDASAGGDRNTCEPRAGSVMTAHNHGTAPTGSRAGLGCMDQGCHAAGGTSTEFAFAGTVYKETSATTPATGVTVRIFKPGENQSLAEAVTDDAGNFVIRNPAMFTAFPYETHVTVCGVSMDIRRMVTQITAGDRNCSAGGSCHGMAGNQGAVFIAD